MCAAAGTKMIGARIRRREDPRLVSGHGRYVDDLARPHAAHLAVVRSPHAHARITSIDTSVVRGAPGVVGAYVAEDIEKVISGAMPAAPPTFVFERRTVPDRLPIARSEVC